MTFRFCGRAGAISSQGSRDVYVDGIGTTLRKEVVVYEYTCNCCSCHVDISSFLFI